MKRNAVIKLLGLLTCVAVLVAHGVSADDIFAVRQQIKKIDAEIAKREANIEKYRELKSQWLWEQTKLVQEMGTASQATRGGMVSAGPRDFAHDYTRLQNDIAAVKPGIEREERKIILLTQEKTRILNQQKNSCFPGETLVLTEKGRLKPIEQVKPGDRVMTFDIGAQADIPKPVLHTYKSSNNHYYLINNAWKKILHLKQGDKIHTSQGLETIHSLVVQYEPLEVHNLHVEGSHTFYVVGEDEKLYLVHNTGGGGGGGK
jgi:hypothetical protein